MEQIRSHKDLVVWQKAISLVLTVYKLTSRYPKEEVYGLTSQLRRASVSIPSNIAEGRSRGTRKDFSQFLRVAYGSAAELETQIIIAKQILPQDPLLLTETEGLLNEVLRMLNVMIKRINENPKS